MKRNNDDPMRDDFQRLRSETEGTGRVPDFRAMMDQAKADAKGAPVLQVEQGGHRDRSSSPRRHVLWAGGWASAAVAASIAGVLLFGGGPSPDEQFELLVSAYSTDVSAGAWRSPTSSLLDVPGMNLTRSVPSIGGMLRSLDPSQLPNVPDSEGRDS